MIINQRTSHLHELRIPGLQFPYCPTCQHARNTVFISEIFHFQHDDTEFFPTCYICNSIASTEAEGKLRKFSDCTWTKIKHAAALRNNFSTDKYVEVTQKVLMSSDNESLILSYHLSCYKKYTAVKRPKEALPTDDEPTTKKAYIETRRSGLLPKSDQQGLLKRSCIFCGKSRKKRNGKEEPRPKVSTVAGCESLGQRAINSKNERIKSLIRSGVDLIAKEAEYHKSCRVLFLRETDLDNEEKPREVSSSQSYHNSAFASLVSFIENEVLRKNRSVFVSDLLAMYKEEYTGVGGDWTDVQAYTAQNLTRKIEEHLKEKVTIRLVNQRKGNFIYNSVISEDDARNRLHKDAERYEEDNKLRWAALHLRSQIMKLQKTETPNPATVQNLKDCAPEMPEQLDLFFRTLLGGVTPTFHGTQKDTLERKVTENGIRCCL